MRRREFVALAGGVLLAQTQPKRIAALVSEYRPGSHADAIVGKVLNGYYRDGQHREPRVRLVSMYTDQVPDEDMSRDLAAKHGFKLLPSIREALTLTSSTSKGSRKLAVDGVLLICEHGDYPYNSLGQKLYPRAEFFAQVLDVFRETGQVVPVFIDKHLSYDWQKAKRMYDDARALKVPLMAGSVEPISRDPQQSAMLAGLNVERAVSTWSADFFDSKDSYGFHAIESMQTMIERRAGNETGVAAVQCLEREAAWEWTAATPWAAQLLEASVGGSVAAIREKVRDPIVFLTEYNSGLQTAIFRLNGWPARRGFAALTKGNAQPVTVANYGAPAPKIAVPSDLRGKYPYNHFGATVMHFEDMVLSGRPPSPVERTLLTSGMLSGMFESSYLPAAMYGRSLQHGRHLEKGRRIETAHLKITYSVPLDAGQIRPVNPWIPEFTDASAAKGWKLGTFQSPTINKKVGYFVYLPPSYEASPSRRYPVVYWLHGFNGNPTAATPVVERLDKAIRGKQAPEMIVVSCVDPQRISQWTDSKDGKYPVETVIVRDLIPHIDATFRTVPTRAKRGIEGYSMGGYGAAYIGFRNLPLFGSISALAGGMLTAEHMCRVRDGVIFDTVYNHDREYAEKHSIWTVTREAAPRIKEMKPFLRVHVGDKDVSVDQSVKFHEALVELGVPHEWSFVPGAEHNTAQTFDLWPGNPFEFWTRSFA